MSDVLNNPVAGEGVRAIRDVLVVGGGLAGMAAACALTRSGFRVQLLERRPYVGGRASSYEHPGIGETIDNCQHVLLGCCTNLKDFYERIGVDRKIDWTDSITFVEPGGRRSTLKPGVLPAPMHSSVSFLSASMLGFEDKAGISRAMRQLMHGPLPDDGTSFGAWLRATRQTAAAIGRFWQPILVSALNDEPDNCSLYYGTQVFYESLLKSPQAGYMGVSTVPLGELYSRGVKWLQEQGSTVHLRASVERLQYDPTRSQWHAFTLDQKYSGDAVVFALPHQGLRRLLPEIAMGHPASVQQLERKLARFASSPITGIHLWLDRVITDLPHAGLLDSPIHWMFQKSRIQPGTRGSMQGSYLELVVSASVEMVGMSRQQVIDLAMRELPLYFPAMHGARLLKSAVVKEVNATFCVPPGVDDFRPGAIAPWPRAFLAGDWTATGWPATMEGAVRSGYLAAEALCSAAGRPDRHLQPDMPERGLMRMISRRTDTVAGSAYS